MRVCFCFKAEDGIRDLVRSRGLGDVYKRQVFPISPNRAQAIARSSATRGGRDCARTPTTPHYTCLLYTSDAADERSSVDLGGRSIIKKKITENKTCTQRITTIHYDIEHAHNTQTQHHTK